MQNSIHTVSSRCPLNRLGFTRTDDASFEVSFIHPVYKAGIKVLLMVAEDGSGYPLNHSLVCFSESEATQAEIGVDVDSIVAEIEA
jgi:hypothetical protein